ncbi:hypothetical protein L9F63_011799, partial [Diploptera punctata]
VQQVRTKSSASSGNKSISVKYVPFISSADLVETCSYDYLEILEIVPGSNSSSVPTRKLCGDWSSKLKLLRYVSRGPRLRLRFVSDYSHHYGGFKAKVSMEN